jgi:hypothetical protein
LVRNVDDLMKVMDVKNLTVEYGGTECVEDCIKSYGKILEATALIEKRFLESLAVNEERMRKYENESVGSFRKLEID